MADTHFVTELKARADILEVVSESVSLRRSGSNWVGLCPFHAEKTPSFSVSPAKQIFHCFGCGTGGDVISFVMKRDGISFREALEILAARYGLEVPRQNPRAVEKRDRLLSLMKSAEAFFVRNLERDVRARRYLEARGLDGGTVRRFGIGSAPEAWRALQSHLEGLGLPLSLMMEAGLVLKGERGTPYDAFRGRLIVPIRNLHGRTVAFGGRTLNDEGRPKYLNSPQSILFNKSELLFALDLARDEIRQEGEALVTEGYMDAIAAHQFGFRNTVATLGTALTAGHARLLKRFTRRILLVFDGDEAGRRAARRALPVLLAEDLEPRVLVLPEGQDPDAFLRKHGPDAFRAERDRARPLVDFLLDGLIGGNASPRRAASEALTLVAEIPDAVYRGQTVKLLAEKLEIAERYLAEELDRRMRRRRPGPTATPDRSEPPLSAAGAEETARAEELLLSAALDHPGLLDRLFEQAAADDFRHPLTRRIFVTLHTLHERGSAGSAEAVQAGLDDAAKGLFARLRLEAPETPEEGEKVFRDALGHILRRRDRDRQRALKSRIREGSREAMERFLEEQRRIRSRRNRQT